MYFVVQVNLDIFCSKTFLTIDASVKPEIVGNPYEAVIKFFHRAEQMPPVKC